MAAAPTVRVAASFDGRPMPLVAVRALEALADMPEASVAAVVDVLEHRNSAAFGAVELAALSAVDPLWELATVVATSAYGQQAVRYTAAHAETAWPGIRQQMVDAASAALAAIELIDHALPGEEPSGHSPLEVLADAVEQTLGGEA